MCAMRALTGFSDASLGARIRTLAMPDSTAPVGLGAWRTCRSTTRTHCAPWSGTGDDKAMASSRAFAFPVKQRRHLSLTNGARVKVTQAGGKRPGQLSL